MLNDLYQTLEDKSNVDYVEENGPFICERRDAWLGRGYYYWDTFVDNAHLWGKKIYNSNNKDYMICLSKVEFSNENVYDLDCPSTLLEFQILEKKLSEKYPNKNITVAVVLEQLKQSQEFTYKAIRARAVDDMNMNGFKKKIPFRVGHMSYLDTCPHIQVCILDKTFVGNGNFKVIFPSEYSESYAI